MDNAAENRRLSDWDLRPWALAALLGAAGLLVHLLTHNAADSGIRAALAALVAVGSIALAFTLDEDRWKEPAIFAALVGFVIGGLVWRAVGQADDLAAEEYGIMAGILAAGLSLPLFQAGFHRLRWRTSYADTHYHVWTDAITAGGSFAFVGLSWLVLLLVGALLDLVGIPLNEIYDEGWFGWTFSGAAFGAALGVLRNQLKIIGTLQSVVLTVFSLLAVPVALAVSVFLAAVIVSGPSVLWDATDSATPILLAIAAGSFVLVNAVIRDDAEGMSGNPAMRLAARVLALGILPLTGFAAISMGVRIDQHGLTPERLWGLAAIIVAVAYGVAYFVDSVRGWKDGWAEALRASNLKLAVGTASYALLLALPILNFGSISAASQVARLESGAISLDRFDFDSLKWEFGEPGRAALERLAQSRRQDIAQAAKQAQADNSRQRDIFGRPEPKHLRGERLANLTIVGADDRLATAIRDYIGRGGGIICNRTCRAIVVGPHSRGTHVILTNGKGLKHVVFDEEGIAYEMLALDGRLKRDADPGPREPFGEDGNKGELTIRPYRGRQLYLDDEPIGEPFE